MNNILLIGMPGGGEILVILFIVFCLILPFVALVDIATSNFKDGVTKLLWVVVVIFAPPIGSVIYFLVGKQQKVNKREFNPNRND